MSDGCADSADFYRRQCGCRGGSRAYLAERFAAWRHEHVPMGLDATAMVRGRPRRGWAWLWRHVGRWMARRAGWVFLEREERHG
jgi:hypothetical protein